MTPDTSKFTIKFNNRRLRATPTNDERSESEVFESTQGAHTVSDNPTTPSGTAYYYAATLTTCEGTWLALPPDAAEKQRIDAASQAVREQRKLAVEFYQDPRQAKIFSLELFRTEDFAPLHLNDTLIEQILSAVGEPPVVQDSDDPAFATYMRHAVLSIATARVRSALAGQLRRFLPGYVAGEAWHKAIAVDNNAFRTALGNEVSPFLVQMTLGGLARWYEHHEREEI
jgi:hypothetical protein